MHGRGGHGPGERSPHGLLGRAGGVAGTARSLGSLRAAAQAALLSLVALGPACGGVHEAERPSFLLVSVDTLRADHTTAYGYEVRDTTPYLEELAREGARFVRAYAPSATTGPSHASLFTSLHPVTHGVVKNGVSLDEAHRTLAEILRARGYHTAGIASSYVLSQRFGYAQGFAHYEDDFDFESSTSKRRRWEGFEIEEGFDRRADEATARALRWLEEERDPSRPFFLFVHYFDPHSPYVPPQRYAERFDVADVRPRSLEGVRRRYDAEIAFADRELGRLLAGLDRLGLRRDTLVAYAADHGEGLMDHGHMGHGVHVYEEQVRVPLVLRMPGRIAAGARLEGPAALVDVVPTALELLGVRAEGDAFQGRSLAGPLRSGTAPPSDRPVLLYRRHYEPGRVARVRVAGEAFGLVRGDWKYIEAPDERRRELYDLQRDPEERVDRRAREPERARRLSARMHALLRDYARRDETVPKLPEGVRRRLEALGYVE